MVSWSCPAVFFFNDTATTEIYTQQDTLSLHDALPINNNLAAPLLAGVLGGPLLSSFVGAVAFAAIIAVVAGLAITASSAFAHDIWFNLVRDGEGDETEHLFVARATAVVVGVLAIALSIALRSYNVAFLVGLAFAVAASANVPVILLSLSWRRFSRGGAIAGMLCGLVVSLAAILTSPIVLGTHALFPLHNPGIVSIPAGFFGAIAGSLVWPDAQAQALFDRLRVRATTGLGAEV
jgi:cation/acetate symporter